ncbi:MAG TPA: hypothetical protein VJT81_06420 [Burkholderiales bacterium]|nr:hypothetical protein [Burkholderiales bacterium]
MRSRTGFVAFAEVTLRSEAQNEELQPATSREAAAAIFMALAASGPGHDPADEDTWDREIELLDEYFDVEEDLEEDLEAELRNVTIPTKH